MKLRLFFVFALFLLTPFATHPIIAQTPEKPMIMPVAGEASVGTWLFGQAYGNTTGAFNFGSEWYEAGQGLHFGIDLSMSCGTLLVAVADGTVQFVDDRGFGSMPHNLIIRHEALGVTTLYGHLLQTPTLMPGQLVQQGEVVGLSGDPDDTCVGRPHLHFEIRSLDYSRTYNPVDFIDANWHSLALIGPYSYPLFQTDLQNPRQWVSMEDQPEVQFWGRRLNNYSVTYPVSNTRRPTDSPQPYRVAPALPENSTFTTKQLTHNECCSLAEWHPLEPNLFYAVDGTPGNTAGVYQWDINNLEAGGTLMRPAPLPYTSPYGIHQLEPFINGFTKVRGSDFEVNVETNNRIPTVNPANTRLLWAANNGVVIPGQQRPITRILVSAMNGDERQEIYAAPGADARWLDNTRILISERDNARSTTLKIYSLADNTMIELGRWQELRGLDASPGGRYIAFYLSRQENTADNGIYMIDTENENALQKMAWFGAWRWRDVNTLYYIPFEPDQRYHTLRVYSLENGTDQQLMTPATVPFTIANGEWQVSADGTRILYRDARDNNLYVLEQQ